MKTFRNVIIELRVDVSKGTDRTIDPEIKYAMEYARLVVGKAPKGQWLEVPYSVSDYNRRGPIHVRFHHHMSESDAETH